MITSDQIRQARAEFQETLVAGRGTAEREFELNFQRTFGVHAMDELSATLAYTPEDMGGFIAAKFPMIDGRAVHVNIFVTFTSGVWFAQVGEYGIPYMVSVGQYRSHPFTTLMAVVGNLTGL